MSYITAERIGRPPLTPDRQAALVRRAAQGDKEARGLLVEHNMGFIIDRVMENKLAKAKMDHDELVNVGVVAYLQSLETFDESKGFKFNTYADFRIRHEVQQVVGQTATGIPHSRHDATFRGMVYAIKDKLHGELGRPPTPEEVAAAMPVTQSQSYNDRLAQAKKVMEIPAVRSLDADLTSEEEGTLYDVTADETVDTPEEYLIKQENLRETKEWTKPVIEELLNVLNPTQREVVSRRYGLAPFEFNPDAAELGDGKKRGQSEGEGGDAALLDLNVIAKQMGLSERSVSAYLMSATKAMKRVAS